MKGSQVTSGDLNKLSVLTPFSVRELFFKPWCTRWIRKTRHLQNICKSNRKVSQELEEWRWFFFKGWNPINLLVILLMCFVGTISQTVSPLWQWENKKKMHSTEGALFYPFLVSFQASKCKQVLHFSGTLISESSCREQLQTAFTLFNWAMKKGPLVVQGI